MTNVVSSPRRVTFVTGATSATDPSKPAARPAQRFPTLVQMSVTGNPSATFEFPYPPANLQYSNLTPEWVEIDRPGYVPLVGLSKYKLMRIQFDFLIAIPYDGLWYSVEDALGTLRRMALSTDRIYFYGMDTMTRDGLPIPGTQRAASGGAMFFRIVDFSVQSMRRNTSNEITAAQCSIILQEDFVLNINAIRMPAILYPAIVSPRTSSTKLDDDETPRCTVSSQWLTGCLQNYATNSITITDKEGNILPGSGGV